MKKKMLIMMNSMGIGGVEKALLNLLRVLDKDDFEVTILFLDKNGEYLKEIPEWVHVCEVGLTENDKKLVRRGVKALIFERIKTFKLISIVRILLSLLSEKVISKKKASGSIVFEEIGKNIRELDMNFDVALDFHGYSSFTTYIVAEKIKATVKATWLHSSNFDQSLKKFSLYYDKYDKVFGVSKYCIEKFVGIFPNYKNKCETFYNIVMTDEILVKAKSEINIKEYKENLNQVIIATVGRLAFQKGYDLALLVASRLKKDGFDFKWLVIGEGSHRENLETLIKEYDLSDIFILLGSIENPYPFIEQSDIYVQPSRWEGYCTTLTEAAILKKPIVTTNVSGAMEQVNNFETGLVVEIEEMEIYNAIKKLLLDKDLRSKFESNLAKNKVDTTKELIKLYD